MIVVFVLYTILLLLTLAHFCGIQWLSNRWIPTVFGVALQTAATIALNGRTGDALDAFILFSLFVFLPLSICAFLNHSQRLTVLVWVWFSTFILSHSN
jgi:hypothetical protein